MMRSVAKGLRPESRQTCSLWLSSPKAGCTMRRSRLPRGPVGMSRAARFTYGAGRVSWDWRECDGDGEGATPARAKRWACAAVFSVLHRHLIFIVAANALAWRVRMERALDTAEAPSMYFSAPSTVMALCTEGCRYTRGRHASGCMVNAAALLGQNNVGTFPGTYLSI